MIQKQYFNRILQFCGVEIWKQNGEFLVVDKFFGYGKFYHTLEEAKNDPHLRRRVNENF